MLSAGTASTDRAKVGERVVSRRVRVWVCAYREVRSQTICGVRNPVVPVDVVQWIVSQLSEVSQHITSATTAMLHLVAEIANLRELRTRDATSVVEALAAARTRSGSPGAVDNGVGRSDPALRSCRRSTRSFQSTMVSLSTFYHGLWQWRRGRS